VVPKSQSLHEGSATDRAIDEHLADQAASESVEAVSTGGPAGSVDLELLRKKAAERDEFLSLLQHVRADFANYQKRILKEIEATRRFASQPLVLDLLPGLDNLERALLSSEPAANSSGLLEGVRMVHQQIIAALARHGVAPIEAAGRPFDPTFHEAVMEQPNADNPDGTVLQELQRGYCLHDRVIRPAKVIVSRHTSRPTGSKST